MPSVFPTCRTSRLRIQDLTVSVKVGIAFVRGNFRFDFTLLDQKPPSHSKFDAVGKGAGVSVRLTASMDLNEVGRGYYAIGVEN